MSTIEAADGRWPQLLADLAGLTAEQLTPNKHQACPACGGTDRYRWISDDGPGSWFCNQCGGRDGRGGGGTGIGLLMRVRNLTYRQAATMAEQHLGIPSDARPSAPRRAPAREPDPEPEPQAAPLPPAPPVLATVDEPIELQHPYSYSPTQRVTRVETVVNGKRRKRFNVFHLGPDGEWMAGAGLDPWPILGEALVHAQRDWVVEIEGEKCVRILLAAGVVAFTHPGHAHKIDQCQARYAAMKTAGVPGVVLISDNDEEGNRRARVGRKAAGKAGLPLLHVPALRIWPDLPQGGNIDDAPGTIDEQLEALERTIAEAWADAQQQPDEPQPPPPADFNGSAPFRLLGYDVDGFYYQPGATGQVVRLCRSAHTGTNLVALAPISYWEIHFPSTSGRGGPNWTAAASELFASQYRRGMFDPSTLRGRGAWIDRGRPVLHLGDRINMAGTIHALTDRIDTNYHYQRAERLQGPGDARPLTDDEGLELLRIASQFRWEKPASAFLMAGWIALAPVCGVLRWRPHVWLTASAGSGKSTLLDRFAVVLLHDMAAYFMGSASTEAGIRQALRSDALPVVLDEMETNERKDQERVQMILALARGASSESTADTVKGTPGHEAMRFRTRSMFLMCSISPALKEFADHRRFAQLQLRPPHEGTPAERQAHWDQLNRDLEATVTEETARRLLARILSMAEQIRPIVDVFRAAAAQHFGQQLLGDQYGTLMAGAWMLQSGTVPTHAEALAWITSCDWSTYQEATEAPDEQRCLRAIVEHQLRIEGNLGTCTRTVSELVQVVRGLSTPNDPVTAAEATAALGRNGLRVHEGMLLVSNTATAIRARLKETPWSCSWPALLSRLDGAQKPGVVRFPGLGTHRCTAVPLRHLE